MNMSKITAVTRLAMRQTYLTKSTPNLANGMGTVRYQWGLGSHHGDKVDKPYYTYDEKASERKEKVKQRLEEAKEDLKGQYQEHKEGWKEGREKIKDDIQYAKDQIKGKLSGLGESINKKPESTFQPIKPIGTETGRSAAQQIAGTQADRMAYEGNVWDGNEHRAKEGTAKNNENLTTKATEKVKEAGDKLKETGGTIKDKIIEGAQKVKDKLF